MRWAGQVRRTGEHLYLKRASLNSHECMTFAEVRGIDGTPERGRRDNRFAFYLMIILVSGDSLDIKELTYSIILNFILYFEWF